MPSRFDVYGFSGGTLDEVARAVERALGVPLETRDSGYYGGEYRALRLGPGRGLKLYANFDAARSEWIRGEWRDHAVLMEAGDLDDMESLPARLAAAGLSPVVLKSSVYPDEEENEEGEEEEDGGVE